MRRKPESPGVGIIHASPWKDAVIKLLEPRSPYRPWQPESVEPAGTVVVVLDTDPQSVLTAVGFIGPDGDVDRALAKIERHKLGGLLEFATFNELTQLHMDDGGYGIFHQAAPDQVVQVVDRYTRAPASAMFGHTSLASARILLKSAGMCAGCNRPIDLTGENARDRVHIHAINAGHSDTRDWPAVLCDDCHVQMREGGFTNFLDFRYSLNPPCPQCSAKRTRSTMYGMPAGPVEEPWVASMGCCVRPYKWSCSECGHLW